MPFSTTFVLLQQEAFLACGSLSTGLTSLRAAEFPDTEKFYSGFFNVSIALERILKLVLVVDHMSKHSFRAPTKHELKAYGHDICTLYRMGVALAQTHGVRGFYWPEDGSIELRMLEFFSEFARKSRYYNLDALVTLPGQYTEPLGVWDAILKDVLANDVPRKRIAARMVQAKAVHDILANSMHAVQHGMNGELLSLREVFAAPARHQLAVPYAMVRLFRILLPILELADLTARRAYSLNHREVKGTQHIPLLHEFFNRFKASDAQIRRKKRWP